MENDDEKSQTRGLFEGPWWYKIVVAVGTGCGIAGGVVIVRMMIEVVRRLWDFFTANS